ncbi:MAG: hypothetical protein ABH854_00300 [Candidatus Diapherotrites archaeon]|nr:hypothetical protein [Candidatus Micrarchaeota archaeon]MBU1939409.1 hypothetical protein [Candidatus Micrarchaeota archaeon]
MMTNKGRKTRIRDSKRKLAREHIAPLSKKTLTDLLHALIRNKGEDPAKVLKFEYELDADILKRNGFDAQYLWDMDYRVLHLAELGFPIEDLRAVKYADGNRGIAEGVLADFYPDYKPPLRKKK